MRGHVLPSCLEQSAVDNIVLSLEAVSTVHPL